MIKKKFKPRKNATHYINNKQLKAAKKLPLDEQPRAPRLVGEAILLICSRLGVRPNFSGYSYLDEMIGDAICNCTAAINNFDVKRFNNPFGYFTQIAWHSFIYRLTLERKEAYKKYKNYENMFVIPENYEDGDDQVQKSTNVNVDEFISSFEKTMLKPKKKGKKKVLRQLG